LEKYCFEKALIISKANWFNRKVSPLVRFFFLDTQAIFGCWVINFVYYFVNGKKLFIFALPNGVKVDFGMGIKAIFFHFKFARDGFYVTFADPKRVG
jgi:hypothetical protein